MQSANYPRDFFGIFMKHVKFFFPNIANVKCDEQL